jgi:hypothetical protein
VTTLFTGAGVKTRTTMECDAETALTGVPTRVDDAQRHCCIGRKSDTTPTPREAGRVYKPNKMAEFGPHKSPN